MTDHAKTIKKQRKTIKRARRELRSLKLGRLGLWLTPIIGWLALPKNTRKQDALKQQVAMAEQSITLAEQAMLMEAQAEAQRAALEQRDDR